MEYRNGRLGAWAAVALALGAAPAGAQDAPWRDCRTCHQVVAPDGTQLARGGRAGPNLYGIAGRELAADPGFALYSQDLKAAAATGARWTRENFIAYLADPDGFLQRLTGDANASSGMHVRQPRDGDALFDYLQDLSRSGG